MRASSIRNALKPERNLTAAAPRYTARYPLTLVMLLIAGCVSTPIEGIVTDIDTAGWKVGYQRDFGVGNGYIREFVPVGEDIDHWSRLLSVQFYEGNKTPVALYAKYFGETRQRQCPGTKFQILRTEEYSVSYYFEFPDCMGQKAQAEVTRLIQGNDGFHRISYAEKGTGLSSATRDKWLQKFERAYVTKGKDKAPIRLPE